MTFDNETVPSDVARNDRFAKTADAMVAFWHKVTHFGNSEQPSAESPSPLPPHQQTERGTTFDLPINMVELGTIFGDDALEIVAHRDVLRQWETSPSTAIKGRQAMVLQAVAARSTVQALNEVYGERVWMTDFHQREGGVHESGITRTELTPFEEAFSALIGAALTDAKAYNTRTLLSESFNQPLAEWVQHYTRLRTKEMKVQIENFMAEHGRAPNRSDIKAIVNTVRAKYPPLSVPKLTVSEVVATPANVQTDAKGLQAWKQAVRDARKNTAFVDSIEGITEREKTAIQNYYDTLAQQDPATLPVFMKGDQAEHRKVHGTPYEQQLAIDLGLGIRDPKDKERKKFVTLPPAITAVRGFLAQFQSHFRNKALEAFEAQKKTVTE